MGPTIGFVFEIRQLGVFGIAVSFHITPVETRRARGSAARGDPDRDCKKLPFSLILKRNGPTNFKNLTAHRRGWEIKCKGRPKPCVAKNVRYQRKVTKKKQGTTQEARAKGRNRANEGDLHPQKPPLKESQR